MMKNMPRNNRQWLWLASLALLASALIFWLTFPGEKPTGAQQAGSGVGNMTNVAPSPASGAMPTEALPASVAPVNEAGKKNLRKKLVQPEPDVPASAVAVVKPPAPRQAVVYGLPAVPEEDKQPSVGDNIESSTPRPR